MSDETKSYRPRARGEPLDDAQRINETAEILRLMDEQANRDVQGYFPRIGYLIECTKGRFTITVTGPDSVFSGATLREAWDEMLNAEDV